MHKRNDIVTYVEAFHQEVTGSSFLITARMPDGSINHILVDCGLFQEPTYLRLNYQTEVNVDKIDAILLTHNHMDHVAGVPKLVNMGYNNPIYTSIYTKELMPSFLTDSANQQASNIVELKKRYPNEKFKIPYTIKDVANTMNLVVGVEFSKTITIKNGIKATFFPNGHLLGAACILLQFSHYGAEDVNLLFTGDYKSDNIFFNVTKLPEWVRKLPLTVVTESTYGATEPESRVSCFNQNIEEAVSLNQDILIGVFAQQRMQEILYRIKYLQEIGIIPNKYQICIDGPLGIETCYIYRRLMYSSYHYYDSMFDGDISFFPRNLRQMTKDERITIFDDSTKKIVITTSGMLSHGPAAMYVPMFIQRDSLIHLTGYAAEDTLARKLLESYEIGEIDEIEIGGDLFTPKATVKWTNEFSSHATAPELISFLNQFNDLKFVIINHGETHVKEQFKQRVEKEVCCKNVEIIDRTKLFVVGTYGLIKSMNTKKQIIPNEQSKKDKCKRQYCPNKHPVLARARR